MPSDYNSGPSVNQLVLVNRSKRPLLLLAGELVSGGKQDRIIAKDRIVAPGAEPLPLDVFCVEHGRWSTGSQFAASKSIVHPSVREQAALKQNQDRCLGCCPRRFDLDKQERKCHPAGRSHPGSVPV